MLAKASLKTALLLSFVTMLSACGSQVDWIKSTDMRVYTQDGKPYGEFTATVTSGQTILPAADFPVYNPRNTKEIVGQLSLRTTLTSGTSVVGLTLDLSRVIGIPSGTNDVYLPNGTTIPIAGLNPAAVQTYRTGFGESKVYLNLDSAANTAMLGVAINIKNFQVAIPANIFLPFQLGTVNGVAGLYTGTGDYQSGFGLFMDASPWLQGLKAQGFAKSTMSAKAASQMAFIPQQPPQPVMQKIETHLYKLHVQKARLIVE